MKAFRDWSIRYKLTGLFVLMAFITAMTIAIPIGVFDFLGVRRAMVRDVATLADVLARNSTAALTFRDAKAASDVLQALRAEPSVTTACIYSDDRTPLARYVRDPTGSQFVPPLAQSPQIKFESSRLIQFRDIVLDGEIVGAIYIESDLRKLNDRLREYAATLIVTVFVTLSLALVIAPRLQRPISRPLTGLVETASAISNANDYSIRARLSSGDEFGVLVGAFNGMLDQIQARDQELQSHREQLEQQISTRTAELQEANARLEFQAAALEAAANSIVITDANASIVWTNAAFTKMSGYTAEEVQGKDPRFLHSDQYGTDFYLDMLNTVRSGKVWQGEIISRRKDGSLYTTEMTVTPVFVQPDRVTHFVAIKQDITERKRAEEALRRAEEKYRMIFEDAVIGIFQATPDGRPLSINRAMAQIHGYDSPEQLLAEVSNVATHLFANPYQMHEVMSALQSRGVVRDLELEFFRRDHTKRWVMANIRAVRDSKGEVAFVEGTIEDITERKQAEARVQFLAYYDALTGLPNRTLLQDRLAKALASALRREEKLAVLFLDLDRFKVINDSLGHTIGDLLLQEVAERLKKWSRAQDTIARIGGDEFLIVLTGIKEASDAAIAAERIMDAMTADFVIQGRRFTVSCSIGISIYPEHGVDSETLIKNADAAMYNAKESGRNALRFFTDEMNAEVMERLNVEHNLRQAREKDEFSLVYQLQADIATEKITGVEALLRWNNPELGVVPPARFIRIAESTGLILPIGEWVLREACSAAKSWLENGLLSFPVAVNVSAVQFRHEGFLDLLRRVLRETRLPPQYLELELTESLLLSGADLTFPMLQQLKAMGVKLAIDDFGTGYSSLSYLRQFPVNKLKIDRSFIQHVAIKPDDAAITAAIISMGKSLNLKVLAEGVENEEQMWFLRTHQCDEVQGYYFGTPESPEHITEKLRAHAALAIPARLPVR